MIASIAAIGLIGITTAVVIASVKHIPEGQVYTLHRIGRSTPRLLLPGTHLIVPLMERIARKISLGGRTLRLQAEGTTPAGTVLWQVLDAVRADTIIDHAEQSIRDYIKVHIRDVDNETARERDVRLKTLLNAELRPQGLLVTRVDLHAAVVQSAAEA